MYFLTLYRSKLPEDTYQVRVYVNGNLIPYYQYVRLSQAIVKVSDSFVDNIIVAS